MDYKNKLNTILEDKSLEDKSLEELYPGYDVLAAYSESNQFRHTSEQGELIATLKRLGCKNIWFDSELETLDMTVHCLVPKALQIDQIPTIIQGNEDEYYFVPDRIKTDTTIDPDSLDYVQDEFFDIAAKIYRYDLEFLNSLETKTKELIAQTININPYYTEQPDYKYAKYLRAIIEEPDDEL